ncbi:MAG: uroporphyrinogen decarboxylase [Parachlamydiaceae bacterium]|nr:uroporphyrinogen decarboxylase [Parachlamydiaceae bacterium]
MNDLLLNALKCQNTSRPPIWLMRQAGRYMPAYRALRQKYTFLEMCHQPDLVTEVTLMPIQAFGMDAAIIFSDILVIPEAMGLGLYFEDTVGPIIERPIRNVKDIESICKPDMTTLNYVGRGINQTKNLLDVPLIGFCGAPFTVASYMIEGKTSRDHKLTKQWMLNEPQAFHQLLKKIADWSIEYLNLQIDAGVDAIQIFDSWANALAYSQFCEFSLAYLNYILEGIKDKNIPVILYCRGSSVFAPQLAQIKPAAVSLDWNCDVTRMRQVIPSSIAIQGNLDPHILYASTSVIEKEVNRILDGMEGDKGFIFNLGHGILPDIPEKSVRTLVECVKQRTVCHAMS